MALKQRPEFIGQMVHHALVGDFLLDHSIDLSGHCLTDTLLFERGVHGCGADQLDFVDLLGSQVSDQRTVKVHFWFPFSVELLEEIPDAFVTVVVDQQELRVFREVVLIELLLEGRVGEVELYMPLRVTLDKHFPSVLFR